MPMADFSWLKSFRDWSTEDFAMWILGGLAVFLVWLFHNMRRRALSRSASRLGLQLLPSLSPETLGITDSTFYQAGDILENYLHGTVDGLDTVIFDQKTRSNAADQRSGNSVMEQTIAGFRVSGNSYCRDPGVIQSSEWHVEKIGAWVFVFNQGRLVQPAEIPKFLEEARGWFKIATDPDS